MGVVISMSCICKIFKRMDCTRKAMHHVALQQSETGRAKFVADISIYEPPMLVFVDKSG